MLDFFWNLLDNAIEGIGWCQYLIYIAFLIVGIFFLVKFCDIFVDSASVLAKKLHVSQLIIGLTVVAMGTSCPELAVSVSGSIQALINGTTANIAIGNVVGSNICNILLVLGLSCVFTPIVVKKSVCKKEFPFLLGVTALLLIFGLFFSIGDYPYAITRWEGIILVILIPVYIFFLVYNAKKHPDEQAVEDEEIVDEPLPKAIILTIVGIIGILLGGEFVVYGAQRIAVNTAVACGLNKEMVEALVGLTIVAVGTSLPELVTSVIAAKKGQNELALGNVIGSNIFNTIFVLGIAAVTCDLSTLNSQLWVEVTVMMSITVLVFIMALKGKLSKKDGWILLGLYVLFVVYLILRTVLVK